VSYFAKISGALLDQAGAGGKPIGRLLEHGLSPAGAIDLKPSPWLGPGLGRASSLTGPEAPAVG
jgi:hypothetical protein